MSPFFLGARPRRRRSDAIDVGFRVSATLGGLSLSSLVIVLMATSPVRSGEWVVAAVLSALPMTAAFVFALLSWRELRADRRYLRADRMVMDFSAVRSRVEPLRDEFAAERDRRARSVVVGRLSR